MAKNVRLGILAAMAAGAVLRLVYLFQHRASPFFEPVLLDPGFYHALALRFLEGRWIQETAFFGPPLYSLFLAAIYKISGVGPYGPKLVQISLGVLHVGLIGLLAHRLFGRGAVTVLAAFMAALYAPYIFHEEMMIPEALGMPLYTAALLCALAFWKKPSARGALLLGLLFGLAGLIKAGIFVFALVFTAGFIAAGAGPLRRRLAPALLLVLGWILPIAPVTAHNWVAAHDFVPLTWHGGLNFYIGNHEGADGIYTTPPGIRSNIDGQIIDSKVLAEKEEGRPLKPSEISRFWSHKARVFIREHPQTAARLWVRKIAYFLSWREITDVENPLFARRFAPILDVLVFGFTSLFILALPGLVLGLRELKRSDAVWVLLWFLCYTAGIAFFFVNARYRLPLISALIPFAAFGARRGVDIIRRRGWLALAVWIVSAAAAAGLAHAVPVKPEIATQFCNAGNIYLSKKQMPEALEMLREAIRANPFYGKAYNDIGVVYQQMGKLREAEEYYLKAIQADPLSPHAYSNLGMMADAKGNTNEAERLFLKAIEIQPAMAEAHNNMGMILGKKKDFRGAEPYFKRSIELNPRGIKAYINLGLIYYYTGRVADARAVWQKALEIDPGNQEARLALQSVSR